MSGGVQLDAVTVSRGSATVLDGICLENITLPLRLTGSLPRRSGVPGPVRLLVERLGIDHLLGRLPSQVSGGELQRAAVARAVVHRPQLVLADEPTASLDEVAARSALTLLLELAGEVRAAVVVVTHDQAIADRCDRSVWIRHGTLTVPVPGGAG